MITAKEIWGHDVMPAIGRYVKPDGWSFGNRLEDGEGFSPFRLPTNSGGPITSLAVNVEPTGRTLQRVAGDRCVRVRITFIGDGEENTVASGWMHV